MEYTFSRICDPLNALYYFKGKVFHAESPMFFRVQVRLGSMDLDSASDDTSRVDIDIGMSVKNTNFMNSPLINDIALIRLSKPVMFNGKYKAISNIQ